jgi:hypothetical protein
MEAEGEGGTSTSISAWNQITTCKILVLVKNFTFITTKLMPLYILLLCATSLWGEHGEWIILIHNFCYKTRGYWEELVLHIDASLQLFLFCLAVFLFWGTKICTYGAHGKSNLFSPWICICYYSRVQQGSTAAIFPELQM